MLKKFLYALIAIIQLLIFSCSSQVKAEKPLSRKIENLKAFTKLYGYTRYFNPSDEASKIDWDNFAIYGVKEVLDDSTDDQLKKTLTELFNCITSRLIVYDETEEINNDENAVPQEKSELKLVTWQHLGVHLVEKASYYKSQRVYKNIKTDELENELFNRFPDNDEKYSARLNSTLFCSIPLTLYCSGSGTQANNNVYSIKSLLAILDNMILTDSTANNKYIRLADVVISWNVFQHFYPYFDVINVDWENVLIETLEETLENRNADDFYESLCRMVAKLQDGHGVVYYRREKDLGGLPIAVEWIENNVVITASTDTLFKKGDIIENVDSVSAEKILIEEEIYISGSPQLKRFRALNQFGHGPIGSVANLEIKRNNKTLNIKTERKKETRNFFFNQITEFIFPTIKEIENKIYYVNLAAIDEETFNNNLNNLASAKGIIFDWRSDGIRREKNPISAIKIIQHLSNSNLKSANWNIPQVIYPDRKKMTFEESNWELTPLYPTFNSKVVFIDQPSVVSFGETIMGIVEYYKLATLIGDATAGTNGNVNFIPLPGGFRIMWTGMKVLKHGGSQHHLIGIKPDVPVKRSIKGVIEGRDEYLEKALEIFNE